MRSRMTRRGDVLIAVLNHQPDLDIARLQHWYRIPVAQVAKLKQRGYWAPRWLAFYQTKVFGTEAYAVRYYAEVTQIHEVYRWELFPDQPQDAKRDERYCKLELLPLETLPHPIVVSQQFRRLTFLATTWEQFIAATSLEDLKH